jgi:hypothetical protein
MSEEALDPARDEFVLRLPSPAEEAVERARRLGAVERFESTPGLCLLRVAPRGTPREAWRAAARELGGEAALFPVLYDPGGAPHYPTGEVTVRFDAAPSDADLRRFCAAQGLRLLRRNEYAEEQAVCEPVAPAREFLPDLVARLAAEPGVRRAWANTLSRYRRAPAERRPGAST